VRVITGSVWRRLELRRPWLALAGFALAAGVLLPPGGTAARHYAFAQAVQFGVLAVAAPALVVLGAPWRFASALTLARRGNVAGQIANARSHQTKGGRAWLPLVAFIAAALAWRLPVAVDALVRYPALAVAEAVTLLTAGGALWLELVESPPLLPRISRPLRAAFAALAMWAIWASAYIMGFSHNAWFSAFAHPAGRGLSTIADQEIAVALLWAIPGLCFAPVVYASLIRWLRDSSDPDDELRRIADGHAGARLPRPPRGWGLPPR
jgi:cytochrome c oxidase assembly factor CtaG